MTETFVGASQQGSGKGRIIDNHMVRRLKAAVSVVDFAVLLTIPGA